MEKASDSEVGRHVRNFIVMASDGSVTAVRGGVSEVFSESISKAAFGFPDVNFITFGTCYGVK